MAGGIFAILDDIATLLDDAALMSKVAAKKTAGLLSDDLAVNAEQATGFHASRELPVIWAITKGSLLNKVIILPVAMLLSTFLPGLIVPILLLGGGYLSYEGAEKISEWISGHKKEEPPARETANKKELVQREKKKIKAAIRTDFILSIEIVVISLETVIGHNPLVQVLVVSLIALLATIGVYGLVALLVRMDDVGLFLLERAVEADGTWARLLETTGKLLVAALPYVIRLLGIVGTLAMLLVGGGMFVHNINAVHHTLEFLPALFANLVTGLVIGGALLGLLDLLKMMRGKS